MIRLLYCLRHTQVMYMLCVGRSRTALMWEAYRRAHVDKLALLFAPKPETGKGRRRSKRRRSPLHGLPPELVRRVVEYWAHAGYY